MIVRCIACDGYGWTTDTFEDGETECGWCGGVGYVYRDADGVDSRIPPADFTRVGETLEALEAERLRELGYTGGAKKPWEQAIRGDNAKRLWKGD